MPKRTRSGATAMDVQEGPGDDDDNFFVDYTQTNTDSGFQRGDEQNQTEEIPRPTSLAEQGAVVLSWEQYQNLVQKVDQKVSTNVSFLYRKSTPGSHVSNSPSVSRLSVRLWTISLPA